MILNKKFNLQIITFIFLLTVYHFSIHNGLEKIFFQTYFDYNDVQRPLNYCNNILNCEKLYCIGMPSGHAESAFIFGFLLYIYKIIPLWLSFFIGFIAIIDRIIYNKHTLIQIFVGLLLGLFYSSIYTQLNLSIYCFFIIILDKRHRLGLLLY